MKIKVLSWHFSKTFLILHVNIISNGMYSRNGSFYILRIVKLCEDMIIWYISIPCIVTIFNISSELVNIMRALSNNLFDTAHSIVGRISVLSVQYKCWRYGNINIYIKIYIDILQTIIQHSKNSKIDWFSKLDRTEYFIPRNIARAYTIIIKHKVSLVISNFSANV